MKKSDLTKTQLKKKQDGICIQSRCLKKKGKKTSYCEKHAKKIYRESNPIKAAYQNLRNSAKRRNKEFSLTFDDFLKFIDRYPEYMQCKGKTKYALHIDRIDPLKGYSLENIRSIKCQENSAKARFDRIAIKAFQKEEDLPF